MSRQNNIPVAVVGVGALFPGSVDAEGFWKNILAGTDLIGDIPAERWRVDDYFDSDASRPDKTYARRGGFLSKTPFDVMRYGVPPNLIEATDTSQLLALIVAQQVLDDAARGQFTDMDREKMSVILGVTSGQELMIEMASRLQRPVWVKTLREMGMPEDEVQQACDRIADHYVDWQEGTFPGLLGNVVAGRIANRFDLGGTNCVTDAACASTLSALSMGLHELWSGDSDVVIAGGVDTFNDIFMYMCFSKTPALSKSGDCRPFSDAADGTMLGEGLSMFALKRLEDAERDGDEIYAVIRGIGSSSDGRSKSIYAPLSEGQAKALRRAYERAGYGPETVELVEAHGTGTKAGDAAEFGGLDAVFGEASDTRQWCALGSVKSQVGHTKAAAGGAGLFKVVMALHHGVLPPTIKVDRPNPNLEIEQSPFYINTEARPWIRGSEHPRRGGVSAFGFGGSNFHTTIEEYTGSQRKPRFFSSMSELVVLGADSTAQLLERLDVLSARAAEADRLDRLAHATQTDFPGGQARLSIVADSLEDLRRKLANARDSIQNNPPDTAFELPNGIYLGFGEHDGELGFLFPGQGSQFVGMGSDLAMAFTEAREVWDRTADVELGDEPLHRVVFPIPAFDDATREAQETKLRATEWAQPALGATSLATLALLRKVGVDADAFAGHSFGEITALCAAGALDETTMLRVARQRGELMAAAAESTTGAMTAVQTDGEKLDQFIAEHSLDVTVANYNSPKQVVISGTLESIEAAEKALKAAELGFTRLKVATAFHSPVVADSVGPFRQFLDDVEIGDAGSVFANTSADRYPTGADERRDLLANQIANSVRFEAMIRNMTDAGVKTLVEVGPGTVLTRLARRIVPDDVMVIPTDAKGRDSVGAFWHALARLTARGIAVDFAPLWADRALPEEPADAPKMTVDIWGGNHNRPYPPPAGTELPPPNPTRTTNARVSGADEVATMKRDDDKANNQPAQRQAPAPAPAQLDPMWVQAFAESQRQMAEAHAAYQNAMAQTHTAFLTALAASQSNLAAMLGGQAPEMPAPAAAAPRFEAPSFSAPASYTPSPVPPPPAPVAAAAPPAPVRPAPAPAPAPARPAPAPAPARAAAPAPAPKPPVATNGGDQDLTGLLLDVVADKTGYPSEMLDLGMQLEADLGIDSIKRVEILSAVSEAAPHLPEVDGTQMAQLNTLGEIVSFLENLGGVEAPAPAPSPAPVADVVPVPNRPATNGAAAGGEEVQDVLLAAVAEKTGYPQEMLELDMQLEADLGIDSIKRVEILSAVTDALPQLPEVDGAEMAALGTLREILEFMNAGLGEKKNSLSA